MARRRSKTGIVIGLAVAGAVALALALGPRMEEPPVHYRGFLIRASASTPSRWTVSNTQNIPNSTSTAIAATGEAPTREEALAAAMAWVDANTGHEVAMPWQQRSKKIKLLIQEGYPPKQAKAIANKMLGEVDPEPSERAKEMLERWPVQISPQQYSVTSSCIGRINSSAEPIDLSTCSAPKTALLTANPSSKRFLSIVSIPL